MDFGLSAEAKLCPQSCHIRDKVFSVLTVTLPRQTSQKVHKKKRQEGLFVEVARLFQVPCVPAD